MKTKDAIGNVELLQVELHPLNRQRLGDIKQLTADIEINGIEVPIIGRWLNAASSTSFYPHRKDTMPVFQVLAGARRVTAARTLNMQFVPTLAREYTDEQAFRFLMRENLHREDVHPLDEALYFDQCIQEGADVDMIAAELGKEPAYVHKRLQLTHLCAAAQTMYEKGEKFGAGVAMELARIPEEAQQQAVKWIRDCTGFGDERSVTVAAVKQWIRNNHVLLLSKACFSPKDATLWPAVGSCVECPKRTGAVPSLFQDLAEKDSCTDRVCWEQKCLKRLEQHVKEFTDASIEWFPLAGWRYDSGAPTMYEGKQILGGNAWDECRQKDKGAFRGLLVRPDDHAQLGKCIWAKQRVRSTYSSLAHQTAQGKAAAARGVRLAKVKRLHRSLVFDAIREAPAPIKGSSSSNTVSFMQRIAIAFWNRLWNESQKAIAKSYGWELIKQKQYNGWDMDRTGRERIICMKPNDLMKFLEVCTVGQSVAQSPYDNSKDELLLYAKEIGVDLPKLQRQAEAKFPAAKKAAKKKTTRKKARAKHAAATK
ncbi:hypothetical protein LCGC14_0996920 [marine sediment metagenome]|uniref:ParB/Sulfiredoxin domain-containing protein n=1 Tax=marine sediment metagenome TaxID=412755 RepID=A0A0F9RAE5_9ZZZZ